MRTGRVALCLVTAVFVAASPTWADKIERGPAKRILLTPEGDTITHRTSEEGEWIYDIVNFGNHDLILKRKWYEEPPTFKLVTIDGKSEYHIIPPPDKAECCICEDHAFEYQNQCFVSATSMCDICYQCPAPESWSALREGKDIADIKPEADPRIVRMKPGGCDIGQ